MLRFDLISLESEFSWIAYYNIIFENYLKKFSSLHHGDSIQDVSLSVRSLELVRAPPSCVLRTRLIRLPSHRWNDICIC